MKIVIFTHEYPPYGGGEGAYINGLAKGLSQITGVKVTVLTEESPPPHLHKIPGVKYITKNLNRRQKNMGSFLYLIKFFFLFLPFYFKTVRKENPDIIYSAFTFPCGLISVLFKPFLRKKVFVDGVGADIYDPVRFKKIRFLINIINFIVLKSADGVTFTSRELMNRVKYKINSFSAGRCIDVNKFKNLNLPRENKLVYTGRLVERKNLFFLLDSFSLITREDKSIKLVIIGGGPLEQKLKDYAAQLKLTDSVLFKGRILEEELIKEYNTAKAFVLTSFYEAFGIVLAEANSCGIPCVVTDCGGVREVIKDGENGFIAFFNEEDFAQKVLKCLKDEIWQAMSEKSVQAAGKFHYGEVSRLVYNFLNGGGV